MEPDQPQRAAVGAYDHLPSKRLASTFRSVKPTPISFQSSCTAMSTASRIDDRLVNIIAQTGLPTFEDACMHSRSCKICRAIDHVTVVCLEREHFGWLFEYVSATPAVS